MNHFSPDIIFVHPKAANELQKATQAYFREAATELENATYEVPNRNAVVKHLRTLELSSVPEFSDLGHQVVNTFNLLRKNSQFTPASKDLAGYAKDRILPYMHTATQHRRGIEFSSIEPGEGLSTTQQGLMSAYLSDVNTALEKRNEIVAKSPLYWN